MNINGDSLTSIQDTDYDASEYQHFGDSDQRRYCRKSGCCSFKTRLGCVSAVSVIIVLIFAALVLIAFLLLPAIVQSAISKSEFEFTRLQMTNPGSQSVSLIADTRLKNVQTLGLTATLHPSELTVLYQGKQVGTFMTEEMVVSSSDSSFVITSDLRITHTSVFDQFALDMMNKESIDLSLTGDLKVSMHVAGTTITVGGIDLNKDVSVQGFNQLKQLTVLGFDVVETSSGDALALINATLFNPSIVDIHPLGTLRLDLFDQYHNLVGMLVGHNVSLYRGANPLQLQASLFGNETAIGGLVSNLLLGSPSVLHATGVADGACSIPLYNGFASKLALTTTLQMPRKSLVSDIQICIDPLTTIEEFISRLLLVVPASARMHCPFTTGIRMTSLALHVVFNTSYVAYTDPSVYIHPLNLSVPGVFPNGTADPVSTPYFDIELLKDGVQYLPELIEALAQLIFAQEVPLGLVGEIGVTVGKLNLRVAINEAAVIPSRVAPLSCWSWLPTAPPTDAPTSEPTAQPALATPAPSTVAPTSATPATSPPTPASSTASPTTATP